MLHRGVNKLKCDLWGFSTVSTVLAFNTFWLLRRLRATSVIRDPKSNAGTRAGRFAMTAHLWHCGRKGITGLSSSDTKAFLATSH